MAPPMTVLDKITTSTVKSANKTGGRRFYPRFSVPVIDVGKPWASKTCAVVDVC
jgi:hypothetical protein